MLTALFFLAACILFGLGASARVFPRHAWLFSIPLGAVFGTWALYLSSLAIGFSPYSIIFSSIALFLGAYFLLRRMPVLDCDVRDAAFFAVCLAASLTALTALLHFDSNGSLYGNGIDMGFYASIVSSIAHGNFPPQYPVAAGEPLSYYYFLFLFAAALYAGGLPLLLAYNFCAALMIASSLSIAFFLARLLLKSTGAALLSVSLVLLAGGLSFIPYLEGTDLSSPSVVASVLTKPGLLLQFQSRGFPVQSLVLRIATMKADWAGLAVFLALAAFVFYGKKDAVSFSIAGSLLGLSAAFDLPLAAVALLVVFFHAAAFDRNRLWLAFFACAAAGFFASLPIFLPKLHAASSSLVFSPFWLSSGSLAGAAIFWLNNFGFVLALAAAGFLSSPPPLRRLFLAALPAFVAMNFVSVFPWQVDNFKLAILLQAVLALLAAAGFLHLWKKGTAFKALGVVLFALTVFSGYLTAASIARFVTLDSLAKPVCAASDIRMAEWARDNLPERSIFIADPYADTSCLTAFSGRLAYYSDMKWIENHGLDMQTRRAELEKMLSGDCGSMSRHGVRYFYEDTGHGWKIPASLLPLAKRLYSEGGLAVYRINCPQ
ncbi:MAG: hypothetical protein V1708_04495 [Candidatus Micrarchaeota archaeon]